MKLARELAIARVRAFAALDFGPIILDGPANLQRGWEAVGGWLALSRDCVAFIPHRQNWQIDRLLIPTTAIRRAWPCWTRLFGAVPVFPNSIAVDATDGWTYRFVVFNRQLWLEAFPCELQP